MESDIRSGQPPQNSRILIVDDSITVVKSLAKILRTAKLQPIECLNGEQALQMAQDHSVDLILLDLVMPHVDGLEVLRRIRATPELFSLPIVVLTATKEEQHLVTALEAGADDYITKPFQPQVLLARIRTHLRSWKLYSQLESANDELKSVQQQEVEAERWKTAVEMAGAAAHKLNQPLTSIVCYADIVLKTLKPEDEHYRAIKSIAEESERMATTLRKMAELTKIRTSEYVGGVTIIDLDRSFERTDPGIIMNKKQGDDDES